MKKLLVIGESCTDIFEYGTCTRLNPEAPTPVFVSKRKITNYGMAGNVAQNLKSLDFAEIWSFNQLSDGEIIKHRIVDEASNYILLRMDVDGTPSLIDFRPAFVMDRIQNSDSVVVSDYNKGYLNEKALKKIAWNAKLSFLDTKKPLGPWAEKFTWIKINKKEYDNPEHDKRFLRDNAHKIIVTLGGNGAMIGDKIYKGVESEVKDVVGAGDSFLAGFAAMYTVTGDLDKSMEFANIAGSHVVKKKGVSDLEEIKDEFFRISQVR
jgi:bifunctional ADP-heptose synthase (sugar kinase/adenylyltransferase)